MKLKLEEIQPDENRSIRLLLTPHLNDFYLWHFHPECELLYIEGTEDSEPESSELEGPRHVGEHMSRYKGSDLVFIGPYIPHLNFDYGVRTDYRKVVVQMRPDFLGEGFFQAPEFAAITGLFERSRYGIAFTGETKRRIGERLMRFHDLLPFRQMVELLEIFQELADSEDYTLLNPRPFESVYNEKEQQRLRRVYRFIEENYQRRINMTELADLMHLTVPAFCRYFRRMTRMTFTDFVNQYRIREAKRGLLLDRSVTEVCFASGFESLSYFNRIFRRVTGLNPREFRRQYARG